MLGVALTPEAASTSGLFRPFLGSLLWKSNLFSNDRLVSCALTIVHNAALFRLASLVSVFVKLDRLMAVRAHRRPHRVLIEIAPDTSKNPVQVRFNWVTPQQQAENYRAAIAAAKRARTSIVFAWSRGLTTFGLPGDQDKLITDVAAVNPNTIVVLNLCQPAAMPWLGQVKAVLQMWWPGDKGGWATARLLLGKGNPGGRLPFTWPKRLTDMPANDPAHASAGADDCAVAYTASDRDRVYSIPKGISWLPGNNGFQRPLLVSGKAGSASSA